MSESRPHASLAPRAGWFRLYRADVARIREHGADDGGTSSSATLLAVWVALNDLANEHQDTTFTVGMGLIAHRAGVSRRSAQYAFPRLEALGMLKRRHNKVHQRRHAPSTWTIYPTAPPVADNATPYSKECHTPMAKDEALLLRTSIKKEKKAFAANTQPLDAAATPQPSRTSRIVSNELPEN
jgi:hypothetical protein